MKVVINRCYGRFSLSPRAVKRLAELQGRPCYFFRTGRDLQTGRLDFDRYEAASIEDLGDELMFFSFDIPNPNEVLRDHANWHSLSDDERKASSALYEKHNIDADHMPRHDPLLVRVVEELGAGHRTGASGQCADLRVVEIPDGTDYEVDEYDGMEHIAEKHRTWRYRLAEIRARLDAATPGPWFATPEMLAAGGSHIAGRSPWVSVPAHVIARCSRIASERTRGPDKAAEANAELIAHAPEDIAYLLAELARVSGGARGDTTP